MIEVNYCLEAMDFADMAALRRRLTRIIPILFFAAVGFGCAVAGFSARYTHQPEEEVLNTSSHTEEIPPEGKPADDPMDHI